MECYLEEKVQGTAMKQKANGRLVSSVMHTEMVDQFANLPRRAVILRFFEGEKVPALIAIPYVRTELQLIFAWCMKGLVMGEYDSEERKRSKEEKVLLMTSLKDIMISEGVTVACAKQRYALRFVRFMLEQISVPALNSSAKILREGRDLAKTLILQEVLDIHQSKTMRVDMKELFELEPIDEIQRSQLRSLGLRNNRWGHC